MNPTARAGMRYGGELSEFPEPWKLQYGEIWSEPRPIKIYSHVFGTSGYSLGGNGHHHVDIKEEDNSIWIEAEGCWGKPWRWNEHREMLRTIKGRYDINTDLFRKKDVVKWAISILKEWGVLGNKKYKITWDLDDDDPLANIILAREMRKRAIEQD